MSMDEFERLVGMVPDDRLDSCVDALLEAQRQYEDTPRPPRALDHEMALSYVINRGSDAPFKLTDAYYVFLGPSIVLRHRSDNVKVRVMGMIDRTIDRASIGTRPMDETEYVAAQNTALRVLIDHTPDRVDEEVEL